MTKYKSKLIAILTAGLLLNVGVTYAQSIERVAFSAAASTDNNFQPVAGAPYGASISSGSGSLEVSSEYGESNYEASTLGTKEFTTQSSVKVYPNPTNDKLLVDLSQANGVANTLILTDLQGKVLSQQEAHTNLETIDMSLYTTGIYLLNVQPKSGNIQSYRIVKK